MAGYAGYSMSNNAVDAYLSGERPKTKWRKQDFVDYAEANYPDVIDKVKKLALSYLRDFALVQSSWHHTSKFYNKTYFYEIDEDFFEDLKNPKPKTAISIPEFLLTYRIKSIDRKAIGRMHGDELLQNVEVSQYTDDYYVIHAANGTRIFSGKCPEIEKYFTYYPGTISDIVVRRGEAKMQRLREKGLIKC